MKKSEEPKSKGEKCSCPYCEEELIISALPYCQSCNVTLRYCIKCQIAVTREVAVCPQCGGGLEWR
ncbi:hypothetical protein ES705_43365 [subsurface metagenome]